ncbi:MAG TPA: mechanosensitive ion channel family protein [Saprospiraceae bacterium]|nr:mechanosensitive ion channel family protein [Saprospiraceae bacterium]
MCKRVFIPVFLLISSFIGLSAQISVDQVNDSPYGVVYNHLYYLQDENYDAVKALRSFQISDAVTVEEAEKLKAILDGRGLYVELDRLPRQSNYADSITGDSRYLLFPSLPEVYLEKNKGQWFYSSETVQSIDKLYSDVYQFGHFLPDLFPQKPWHQKFLGVKWWKYVVFAILFFLILLIYFPLKALLKLILLRLIPSRFTLFENFRPELAKLTHVISLWLVFKLFKSLLPQLFLPVYINSTIFLILNIALIIFLMIAGLRATQIIFDYLKSLTDQTSNTMDDQLIPVLRKMTKVVLIVLAILYILNQLNVNITAILAGVSIGGLALALAAQDTVKNFLGSVMIFLDRPFQIGDWVEFEGVSGSVEEVSIRSTRIRTFQNSVTYVPNGALANKIVDNKGLRIYRRYSGKIGIQYDTPPDVIELFVKGIEKLVEEHKTALSDSYEVHLNNFADSSLEIFIAVLFDVPSFSEELRSKQDLMLSIIRLAAALKVDFAFPTQTVHLASNSERDKNFDFKKAYEDFMNERNNNQTTDS